MYLESAQLLTVITHHRQDAAAARSAATLREQFIDPTAQPKPLNIRSPATETLGVETRAGDFKHLAQRISRLVDAQLVNQRERSRSSDIKSAVAFFYIDVSRSRRAIRASSS